MPFVLFSDTLTQLPPETDAAFSTRVQTYISDQQYYFEQAAGSLPVTSTPSQGAYLGFPPGCPPAWYQGNSIQSNMVWDPVAGQLVRQVTFNYDNTYYYKYLGIVPVLPPPSPLPTAGTLAMFGSMGTVVSTTFAVDTALLTVDWNAYQLKNLLDGVDPQDAVTMSQLAAAIGGTVNTVNGVAPTLGNIQLTVSNSGTAGTLQWNLLDLQIPQADTDTTGLLSDTDWDTFSAKVGPTRTIATTSPLQGGGDLSADRTLSILQSSAIQNGYLSSTDWSTFNSKQPAGSYITALTGDGAATGPGSVALTLATVNAGVGTFGSATKAPVYTVNAKGLITASSEVTITPAAGSITSPQALTRVDDTNVTLSFGGTPGTALLQAVSMTLGWTGQLAVSRGGTGVDTASANTLFAGPTSGGAAAPAFRAMVLADIMSMTSAQFATKISDETGSGLLVFGTTPTVNQPNIVGTTTNNNAAAGSVGEEITQSRVQSAATALTTATTANVTATALTLTAGDWDISAALGVITGGATNITTIIYGVSLTSATTPGTDTTAVPTAGEVRMRVTNVGVVSSGVITYSIPRYRVSLAGSATLYFIVNASFTVSTASAYGSVTARRVR
jgi:hypothetical protein